MSAEPCTNCGCGKHTDLVSNLRDMGQHLGKDTADSASKAAASIAHAAADLVEQARKQAGPILQSAGKEVREHPVSTAAIVAASIGLISYALSRKPETAS